MLSVQFSLLFITVTSHGPQTTQLIWSTIWLNLIHINGTTIWTHAWFLPWIALCRQIYFKTSRKQKSLQKKKRLDSTWLYILYMISIHRWAFLVHSFDFILRVNLMFTQISKLSFINQRVNQIWAHTWTVKALAFHCLAPPSATVRMDGKVFVYTVLLLQWIVTDAASDSSWLWLTVLGVRPTNCTDTFFFQQGITLPETITESLFFI